MERERVWSRITPRRVSGGVIVSEVKWQLSHLPPPGPAPGVWELLVGPESLENSGNRRKFSLGCTDLAGDPALPPIGCETLGKSLSSSELPHSHLGTRELAMCPSGRVEVTNCKVGPHWLDTHSASLQGKDEASATRQNRNSQEMAKSGKKEKKHHRSFHGGREEDEHNSLLCSIFPSPTHRRWHYLPQPTLGYLPHVRETCAGPERLRAVAKVTQLVRGRAGTRSCFLQLSIQ